MKKFTKDFVTDCEKGMYESALLTIYIVICDKWKSRIQCKTRNIKAITVLSVKRVRRYWAVCYGSALLMPLDETTPPRVIFKSAEDYLKFVIKWS